MASGLPYRKQPLIFGRQCAVSASVNGSSGMLIFCQRSETGPDHYDVFEKGEVRFSPYILNGTDPYLEIEVLSRSGVTQTYSSKKPRLVTTLPLAKCAYVAVEYGRLKRLPNVSDRLSPILRRRGSSDKQPPFVFNIHLHGLRVAKLKWYGNNYEDMDEDARKVLDMFNDDLETLEIDILIQDRSSLTFEKAGPFQKVCNAITIFKNPTLQLSLYTTKSFKNKVDPKTPGSPLYNLMGPGKREVSLKYAKECVALTNAIAAAFAGGEISEDRIWEVIEEINAERTKFAKD